MLTWDIGDYFTNKTVAILGSAPNVFDNDGKHIDSHDIVIRINRYPKDGYEEKVGKRTDVFYSFFGRSIRNRITNEVLKKDGVKYLMAKCPNCLVFGWEHTDKCHNYGGDYRYIYTDDPGYYTLPIHIPSKEHFLENYKELNNHVPTTGFACIQDVVKYKPKKIYITGFDFMKSRKHNGNEPWRAPKDHPEENWNGHPWNGEEMIDERLLLKEYTKKYGFINVDKRIQL